MKRWLLLPAWLLLVFLALTALRQQAPEDIQARQFSQKVNLALRYTGDRLLRMEGDSSSRIPAVRQSAHNEWLLRLERRFNYDSLPNLLQTAFQKHGVAGDYQVAVLNCTNGDLMLGYDFSTLQPGSPAACGGRDLEAVCLNIQVVFPNIAAFEPSRWPYVWAVLVGLSGLVLLWFYQKGFRFSRVKGPQALEVGTAVLAESNEANRLSQTVFDPANQTVHVAGHPKALTYREAKLLQLFIAHPNELLSRDHILKAVWEDEGILVGRSVDVFVSRLRKILKEDESLQLVNVHGVGYRLQVSGFEF